ncbi:MAG: hypothetical protein QOD99_1783 [Chthoniobacter sp.]|jgi:putative 4-mercaptohistidine N1-methyltranferase|nr:hypothetical protein [Chthoniobacter sp.]
MAGDAYDSERALSEYLLFHYGTSAEILPYAFGPREAIGFPVRCVSECLDQQSLPARARALDLGCAVGRASFELARHCSEVIGIDSSQSFIRTAAQLKKAGRLGFNRIDEGALTSRCVAEVPHDLDRTRVHFEIGDALRLRSTLGAFDVVLAANVLCRLSEPAKLVLNFPQLVRTGGQLIITSPYTWSREFTPSANWLGGYERDGHRYETFATLEKFLANDFSFLRSRDLPFLIREHARKFQWSVAHASVWIRK